MIVNSFSIHCNNLIKFGKDWKKSWKNIKKNKNVIGKKSWEGINYPSKKKKWLEEVGEK